MSKYSINPLDYVMDYADNLQKDFLKYCSLTDYIVENKKNKVLKKPTHYNITDLKVKWQLKRISEVLNEAEPNFKKNNSFGKSVMKKDYWINCGCSESIANYKVKSHRKLNKEYWELRGLDSKKGVSEFQTENSKKVKNRVNTLEIEYYINKGYTKQEAILKLKERQATFSLQKCIEKYDTLEEATDVFNKRQKKWKKSLKANFEKYGDGRTPQSKSASDIITIICKELGIKKPKKEKYINTGTIAYSYDFCLKDKRKIIEFNGSYWHCDPNFYEENYYNSSIGMTAKEKWEFDKQKIETAKSYGYDVLVIWESEWQDSLVKAATKALNFINK